ncbi:hypothetical protein HYS48_00650 [Candidatus Woesearchaeota archaeon]|nr:hypothetical protein [Candidatus Woesearchaeota archaeon]
MKHPYAVLACLLLALFLIGGCDIVGRGAEDPRKYELTEVDVFSEDKEFKGTQVTVLGVGLGDSSALVEQRLGKPDTMYEFQGTTLFNYEYSKALGLNGTGLTLQVRDGVVNKITVKKPFNKYLKGKTFINHVKEDIYFDLLGVPDRQKVIPFFRIFCYDERGIEVYLETDVNGYGFTYPNQLSC